MGETILTKLADKNFDKKDLETIERIIEKEKESMIEQRITEKAIDKTMEDTSGGRPIIISDKFLRSGTDARTVIFDGEKMQTVELLGDDVGKAIAYTKGLGMSGKNLNTYWVGKDALSNSMLIRRLNAEKNLIISSVDERLKPYWEKIITNLTRRRSLYRDMSLATLKANKMDNATDLSLAYMQSASGLKEKEEERKLRNESVISNIKRSVGL